MAAADAPGEQMPSPESLDAMPTSADPEDVRRPLSPGGPGFLRMRVRLENGGRLTVLSARFVASGNATAEPVGPGYMYEVTSGGRTVTSGNLTDLGVRRSYGDPHAPPERQGHLIISDPNPEFTVRVPAGALSSAELAQTEVALYEVSELPVEPRAPVAAVSRLAGTRQVARTEPDALDQLPRETRAEIALALRK